MNRCFGANFPIPLLYKSLLPISFTSFEVFADVDEDKEPVVMWDLIRMFLPSRKKTAIPSIFPVIEAVNITAGAVCVKIKAYAVPLFLSLLDKAARSVRFKTPHENPLMKLLK